MGYKSPEDAAKAVKYFNKSFIRMSKIAVELATPVRLTEEASLMKILIFNTDIRGHDVFEKTAT